MAESIPLPYIMPPKHMAQIISHTVFIIPPMPPVATRSLSSGLPVSTAVSVVDASTTASNEAASDGASASAMRHIISGWNTTMAAAASSTEAKRVMMAGSLRDMSAPVAAGTASSQGVMLNDSRKAASICNVSASSAGEAANPAAQKTARAMSIEGTVVKSM